MGVELGLSPYRKTRLRVFVKIVLRRIFGPERERERM
jgi:hypothetical protein